MKRESIYAVVLHKREIACEEFKKAIDEDSGHEMTSSKGLWIGRDNYADSPTA